MKYPSHIILDITTKAPYTIESNWNGGYVKGSKSEILNSRVIKRLQALNIKTMVIQPSLTNVTKAPNTKFTPLTLFDIHFLRKEKLYTKLKYSRCPQYDIVSGGFAALLAGFIGFLISEKFGIELVDSGDFYNAFMYGVFIAFSLRPLVRIYSKDNTPYSPISPKYLCLFLRDLSILTLRYFLHLWTWFSARLFSLLTPLSKIIASIIK